MTRKERALSCKSLICYLESLIGKIVTIELRNDSLVKGRLSSVDAYMNSLVDSYQEVDGGKKRPVEVSTPTSILSTEYDVTCLDSIFIKGTDLLVS